MLPVALMTIFSFPGFEILQNAVLSAGYGVPKGPINGISPVDRSMIEGIRQVAAVEMLQKSLVLFFRQLCKK